MHVLSIKMKKLLIIFIVCGFIDANAQANVASEWNEQLLSAIRVDLARPTVHARNLFHSSMLMYDAWAVFDDTAETIFLGKRFGGYICEFNGIEAPTEAFTARHEILSYAMYRFLMHRFSNSDITKTRVTDHFLSYGYNPNDLSTDYSQGSYAALGNYLASEMIQFGLQDGSNEEESYENRYYEPVNAPLEMYRYTDTNITDPNRWQPLAFLEFIDQSGNILEDTPGFLSPEWGEVTPFALNGSDLEIKNNGFDSYVYNDPGPPDYIQDSNENGIDDPYKWGFALVASWSSHLDPNDDTMIDISPGAIGNISSEDFPQTFEEYKAFYDFFEGGDIGNGHAVNPYTNAPYPPRMVKRADYARVLAEFWADGPDSETPPGHWFTIFNHINPAFYTNRRFAGQGPSLSQLEWDVKCYLVLGGALHDAAVNTWGIKGYYDYIRPISAIRYMAEKGQSSDSSLPSYDPHGLPLIPGSIELINAGDPLAIENPDYLGKIKIRAWKGPDYLFTSSSVAGVDWILGTRWWPYQRGTFVTPNFAGYLSGHSTFSRAAAQALTLVTGSPYFPQYYGSFYAERNEFLVFEEGPSENILLEWATYKDASDQTSLSRIWGGIHPPIDDIRGRIIGEKIGNEAFDLAIQYFNGTICNETDCFVEQNDIDIYPVPFDDRLTISSKISGILKAELFSLDGKKVFQKELRFGGNSLSIAIPNLSTGVYVARVSNSINDEILLTKKVIKN